MIQPNFSLFQHLTMLSFASTLLLVGSAGCATRGYQKAAATSDAIAEAANHVELAQRQITEATSALQALSTQNPRELQPAFERYRAAVAALEKTSNQLRQQTNDMEKQGRAYFDLWDVRLGEIRNEDIRARSADRSPTRSHRAIR